ncbi:hypothetical protein V0R37_00870 [Pollutimonas sp. H1-120]|uniref:hypothetical protein n=1 Tax=Pollutimonas sp. H1-120 TaxID=3148824 RepID=UPI003B520104
MHKDHVSPERSATVPKQPAGHTDPDRDPGQERRPATPPADPARPAPYPPDSIPNPMPGVDPQQTPGIDGLPAEENMGDCRLNAGARRSAVLSGQALSAGRLKDGNTC